MRSAPYATCMPLPASSVGPPDHAPSLVGFSPDQHGTFRASLPPRPGRIHRCREFRRQRAQLNSGGPSRRKKESRCRNSNYSKCLAEVLHCSGPPSLLGQPPACPEFTRCRKGPQPAPTCLARRGHARRHTRSTTRSAAATTASSWLATSTAAPSRAASRRADATSTAPASSSWQVGSSQMST